MSRPVSCGKERHSSLTACFWHEARAEILAKKKADDLCQDGENKPINATRRVALSRASTCGERPVSSTRGPTLPLPCLVVELRQQGMRATCHCTTPWPQLS